MNDERQSRLLADFLAALRDDVHAAPPDALDPALAAIARRLVLAKAPPPDAATRERVWLRALAASRPATHSTNGRTPHSATEEIPMTALSRPALGRTANPFLFVAALTLVAAAAMLFFALPPSGPADDLPSMFGNPAEQDATATPLMPPTIVPTSTPFQPTLVPPPTEAVIEHRIQQGETLGYIIQLYGYTDLSIIDQIVALNPGVTSADRLPGAGQTILIPMPTLVPAAQAVGAITATPLPASGVFPVPTLVQNWAQPTVPPPAEVIMEHPVREGETLGAILQMYGFTDFGIVDRVIALNPSLRERGQLPAVGEILNIPIPGALPPDPATMIETIEHTYATGETLEGILEQYGLNTPEIAQQAGLINPELLDGSVNEGDIIFIPLAVPTPGTATPFPFTLSPLATPTPVPFSLSTPPLVPTPVPIMADGSVTVTSGPIAVPTLLLPTVVPPVMLAEPQPLTLGDTLEGVLSPDQPVASFAFTAEQTGPIFARARSEDDLSLSLGFQVTREGSGGGGGGGGSGDRATTQEITGSQYVLEGDQVIVSVINAGLTSGSFALTVQQADAQTIRYGETVEGSISADQPVAYYTFNGEQGDVVTIHVTGEDGFDTRIQLSVMTPDNVLATDDDGGMGFDPEISYESLSGSGEFAIQVHPVMPGGGRFRLSLDRAEPLSLDEGPQTVSFNRKHQPQLVFEGEAGQTIQLNARAVTGGASARYLGMVVMQNGAIIADISRNFGQLSVGTQPADGQLLASGAVTITDDGPVYVHVGASTTLADDSSLTVEVEALPQE